MKKIRKEVERSGGEKKEYRDVKKREDGGNDVKNKGRRKTENGPKD